MAKVYITQSAWQTILEEVRYFARQGNREAIVYPLFGFIRSTECLKAPWEMLEQEDLDSFVVTHAHAPLRKFCAHTGVRAKFVFGNDEEKEEWEKDMSCWSQPLCDAYPSLEIGNVHSHPFAHFWTQPSSGSDQMDYARIYKLWQHLRNRKVNSPLEIILCRSFFGWEKWSACCFTFDAAQNIVSLGKAQIISNHDELAQAVLTIPYWKTTEGRQWEKWQRDNIPEIEEIDRFYFGWSSVRIKRSESNYFFIHLPPQFPFAKSILGQHFDAQAKELSQAQKINVYGSNYRISLREIIQTFKQGG